MKTLALILGMHRSGTSLLSRSLKIFGAEHGDNLLGSRPGNTKGHWEDLDALALNTEMLEFIGKDWKSIGPVTPHECERLEEHGYLEKINNLLYKKFYGTDFFVLKEPRITHLLPIWKKALNQIPLEKKYFFAFREPAHVAQSLRTRDGLPLEQGLLMWFSYTYFSLQHLAQELCCFINYDDMLAEPELCLERIKAFLSRELLVDEKNDFLNFFIDKSLCHFSTDVAITDSAQNLLDQCNKLFELLKNNIEIQQISTLQNSIDTIEFINELGREHAELSVVNRKLQAENIHLQNTLTTIYQSRSWKIIRLIKKTKNLITVREKSRCF